jgi:hypothetical protein
LPALSIGVSYFFSTLLDVPGYALQLDNRLSMRAVSFRSALVVFLAGCGFDASPPARPPLPGEEPFGLYDQVHRQSDRTKLLEDLEAAETYWNAAKLSDYELTVSVHCFCFADLPFVWRVSGEMVEPVTQRYPTFHHTIGVASLRTVGLLFSEARRLALSDLDDVTVEFDPALKFPTRLRIDPWRNSIDDETTVVAQLRIIR